MKRKLVSKDRLDAAERIMTEQNREIAKLHAVIVRQQKALMAMRDLEKDMKIFIKFCEDKPWLNQ